MMDPLFFFSMQKSNQLLQHMLGETVKNLRDLILLPCPPLSQLSLFFSYVLLKSSQSTHRLCKIRRRVMKVLLCVL